MKTIPYVAIVLLAAACASHETKNEVPAPGSAATMAPTSPSASSSATQRMANPVITANPLHDPNSVLAKRSIYFDFDSNAVKDEYEPIVKAHAGFMASHGEARARVEGNCDERGSREYNLALGQRRAESVKRQMVVLGVADGHIETISYGEEKPMAAGHDEASWAKNRRDDIRYTVE